MIGMNWTNLSKQSALWKVQGRAGPSGSGGEGTTTTTSVSDAAGLAPGTNVPSRALSGADEPMEDAMGRYVLLWLLGVPIPILLLIWAFGGLH